MKVNCLQLAVFFTTQLLLLLLLFTVYYRLWLVYSSMVVNLTPAKATGPAVKLPMGLDVFKPAHLSWKLVSKLISLPWQLFKETGGIRIWWFFVTVLSRQVTSHFFSILWSMWACLSTWWIIRFSNPAKIRCFQRIYYTYILMCPLTVFLRLFSGMKSWSPVLRVNYNWFILNIYVFVVLFSLSGSSGAFCVSEVLLGCKAVHLVQVNYNWFIGARCNISN